MCVSIEILLGCRVPVFGAAALVQDAQMPQVAKVFIVIQCISHNKRIRDDEADVYVQKTGEIK